MNRSIAKVLVGLFVGSGILCAPRETTAADTPATQPAEASDGATPRYAADPDALLSRLRSRVDALQLTDAQKQKIDAAFAKAGQSLKLADQELQNATSEQRTGHMRDVLLKLREDIRSALSPEQLRQFRQQMAAAPADMLSRLRDALSKLQLTDDQKQKAHDLLESAGKQLQQAGSEAKTAGLDAGEKLRAVGEDLRQKLGDILNDEQKLRLRRLMENSAPTTRPDTTN
jgi:hypothetical protein